MSEIDIEMESLVPFFAGDKATLYHGDCASILPRLPDASIDAIVTDPPAGISFMGKAWDHHKGGRNEWTAWLASIMRECLRVLKPGGHALVWALPRTSHWTATAVEDAGFEVRDVIHHCFGSGFPKSLDVARAIDRHLGADRTVIVGEGKGRTGDAARPNGSSFSDDDYQWPGKFTITAPASAEAAQWSGYGMGLKPAIEHWILARKPLEGNVAKNVLKCGTGALNIDGCRVGGESTRTRMKDLSAAHGNLWGAPGVNTPITGTKVNPPGRWPANLVHDGSDEVVALFPETTGGLLRAGQTRKDSKGKGGYHGGFPDVATQYDTGGDSGSAARFFYCCKASKEDREEGLDGFTPERRADRQKDNGPGGENPRNRTNNARRNHHPTVKSTALMRWLCCLVTPPGGVVLDPFMGSGSTGKACMIEGFKFIGIEMEREYVEIAKARIEHAAHSSRTLFDAQDGAVADAPLLVDMSETEEELA